MKNSFIFLIGLFLSSYAFSDNEEKTKNLLHALKIDARNSELGKSITPDIKKKWLENITSDEMNNYMVFSGLEYLDSSIEEKIIIRNFRAYADISYYSEAQIEEVKEFIKKLIIENCKVKPFRETLFVLDLEIIIRVIDKLNNPFINIPLNKSVCSKIEPYGRHRSISKKEIRRLRNGPE